MEEKPSESVEIVPIEDNEPNYWMVHSGEALTSDEAYKLTSEHPTKLIALAGPVASGKTTLIASVFHVFQRAEFNNFIFVGSKSLVGFDKRCHMGRTSSYAHKMDTVRTRPSEERRLLHLTIAPRNLVTAEQHVLLLDLSGEDFDDAMESTDEAGRLSILKGASAFCLLIDCSKLIEVTNRQSCLNKSMLMLQSCLDSGVIGGKTNLEIIFSKWDLVITSTNMANTTKFVENAINRAKDQFEQKVGRLSFHRIASRPEHNGSLPLGYGLEELLSSWVNLNYQPRPNTLAAHAGIFREFDRLAFRPVRSSQL